MTYLDSVNYYFGILLNHERDSINYFHRADGGFVKLNHVVVETDRQKFVNPLKHLDYCIEKIHAVEPFYAHTTTNKENFHYSVGTMDYSSDYKNPKKVAHELFWSWKNSDGHYKFMIQRVDDPKYFYFKSRDYKTFKILMKWSFRPDQKRNKWVFVATFTAWE